MNRRTALALLWIGASGPAFGHGLSAARLEGGVGVAATYDDGSPVAFSEVRVFAPGTNTQPALSGTTDRHGCFLFRPDTGGVWRIAVDDGMGHLAAHEIEVGETGPTPGPNRHALPKPYGVVVGLSLLFGIFGWVAFLRIRWKQRRLR